MVRIIDGQPPVTVPDDERITPAMKDLRTAMNTYLRWLAARGPEVRALERAFREGNIADVGDWYTPPKP